MATDLKKIHLTSRDRLNLFNDMATMLGAGISILEVVESLEIDARGNMKHVLVTLRKALNNGETLATALERLPAAFDQISINLIRASEAGGTLEQTLRDLVAADKKEMVFNEQLRTTMIYPAFVMVVFTGIVVLMLTFVIPRVAKVFTSMRVHLPWITKTMISISNAFTHHWAVISLSFVGLLALFALLFTRNKRAIVRVVLGLPFLKRLGTNIDFARFCRSFGLLMHAGVPILDALDLSERVLQKKEIIGVVRAMKSNVEAGKALSFGLHEVSDIVPPLMARSIETAESTGTLDQTMQNLTEYFDDQVSSSLKVIGSLIEPILLVVVGILVGALMITIIAPIYNLISQINSKA